MEYIDFLQAKVQVAPVSGFEISPEMLSSCLKPHQKDAVIDLSAIVAAYLSERGD